MSNDTVAFYVERLRKSQISIISGWISQIRSLLDDVSDLGEFRDRLPDIYSELEIEKFSKNLERATVASSLAGIYEAQLNEMPVEFAEPEEYKTVSFNLAIDFFQNKINLDTNRWDDLKDGEFDAAFVSAGAKGALLQDLRIEVEKAIINGQDRSQFKKEFNDIVDRRGWNARGGNDWRANIIYQTNLRQAYGDGRCRQMSDPDVQSKRPFRMWVHGNSAKPRETHIAMNGKVFRADDPIANQSLPLGFGCRCSWVTLSERDLKRRGLKVTEGLNWGDVIATIKGDRPLEIEKGFRKPCKFESEEERENRRRGQRKVVYDRLPDDDKRGALIAIALGLGGIALVLATMAKTGQTTSTALTALVAEKFKVNVNAIEVEVLGGEVIARRKPTILKPDVKTVDVKSTVVTEPIAATTRKSLPELVVEEILGDVSLPNKWLDLDELEELNVKARAIVLAPPEDIVPGKNYKKPLDLPDSEAPRPVAKKVREVVVPSKVQIDELRRSAKERLLFSVNVNVNPKYPKSVAGTINVQPGKRFNYAWTVEQTTQVREWLESQGYYVKKYQGGDKVYFEGFNFLKRFTD